MNGAQMMLYKLLSRTDQNRFEPVVVTLMEGGVVMDKIHDLGVPIHIVDMSGGKSYFSALWRLSSLLQSLHPDIIQGWMYHGNMALTLCNLSTLKKIPLIWNIRHSLYNLKYESKRTALIIRAGAILSRSPQKIIYNSRKSAEQHENLGYVADRTSVIPNGFDCSLFKPSLSARTKLNKELGIGNQNIVIGLMGRYHPMKDHANFIKAAELVANRFDNVRFVLAGSGMDSNNTAISELITRHGVMNKFFLLGERKDISYLTAALDIACSSSSYGEAFPNVIGEAMACGVPCVVTDVGDSAWIVGDAGKAVPVRNAEELANALTRLIDAGPEERSRLGNRARKRITNHFSLEKITHQYEALYEGLIGWENPLRIQ
jgi:glycosyltransferase involved in cell wall biosynthesis